VQGEATRHGSETQDTCAWTALTPPASLQLQNIQPGVCAMLVSLLDALSLK
jgi:hypothetical protein